MVVSNPAEFVKDPNATIAVATGIAVAINVPPNWVDVTLSLLPTRRLVGAGRKLQGTGEVKVDYVITIPGKTPLVGVGSPSAVTTALEIAEAANFSRAISSSIAGSSVSGMYSITVTSVSGMQDSTTRSTGRSNTTEEHATSVTHPSRESTRVEGSLSMQVSNASAFVINPQVKLALAEGIAKGFGVPASWVDVDLLLGSMRLGVGIRKLQGEGTVVVSYVITVPATADAQDASIISSIVSSIQNAQPAALTVVMTNALSAHLGTGAFDIVVTNIAAPIVHAPATNPATTPAASQGRDVTRDAQSEAEEVTDNTGVVVGAVVAALLVLCCCCVIIAVVGNIVYKGRETRVCEISEVRDNEANELRNAASLQDLPPASSQWQDPIQRMGTQ